MGLFSFLTGTSSSASKAVDAIISTGDALVFTEEEKSVAGQKLLDWKLQWLQLTNPQNKARRVIAYGVVALWIFLILLGVAAHGFKNTEFASYVFKVLTDIVAIPFSIIIGFYYAAHIVRANKSESK